MACLAVCNVCVRVEQQRNSAGQTTHRNVTSSCTAQVSLTSGMAVGNTHSTCHVMLYERRAVCQGRGGNFGTSAATLRTSNAQCTHLCGMVYLAAVGAAPGHAVRL